MEGTLFGLTEERIAELGMTWGVGGFIALMLFIIWKLHFIIILNILQLWMRLWNRKMQTTNMPACRMDVL